VFAREIEVASRNDDYSITARLNALQSN